MKNYALGLAVLGFFVAGCASHKHVINSDPKTLAAKWQKEPQIEIGRPKIVFDTLGNVLSLPKKIILINFKIDNHAFSPETRKIFEEYFQEKMGFVNDTKVRVNQFSPVREYQRLVRNKKISWWWRVFPGIPVTTISLAGRLLGGDNYNPYTDTISLYSDIPSVALHEAAHAVDTAEKVKEGWADVYTLGRILPPVTLHQECVASEKVLAYLEEKRDRKQESHAYKTLYPAFGTYAGGTTGIPYGDVVGAAIGHVASLGIRSDNKLKYLVYDNAAWSDETVKNFRTDPLAKSLLDDNEKKEAVFERAFSMSGLDVNK